jgi:hypothetical protein
MNVPLFTIPVYFPGKKHGKRQYKKQPDASNQQGVRLKLH